MSTNFHIFASSGEEFYTVREPGAIAEDEGRQYASLFDATQVVRGELPADGAWIIIHDEEGHTNRIPMRRDC
jgi:hypothetical protein